MAVSKPALKTPNKGKMQEASSIRCKYVLFLRILDQEFLSKLPAGLIFVHEPPVCCVTAQLCSCEQTAALQRHPLLRGRLQLVLHVSSQFLCLHPIFALQNRLRKKKIKRTTRKKTHTRITVLQDGVLSQQHVSSF